MDPVLHKARKLQADERIAAQTEANTQGIREIKELLVQILDVLQDNTDSKPQTRRAAKAKE